MSSVTLPSPAKINLFLHITGRRDNGYHDLQTVFQLLDFGDTLTFTPNNSGQINLSPQIEGVLAEDNLIVRAARLLQQKTAGTRGCDIVLNKVLPMGAGLGGGSSNAFAFVQCETMLGDVSHAQNIHSLTHTLAHSLTHRSACMYHHHHHHWVDFDDFSCPLSNHDLNDFLITHVL